MTTIGSKLGPYEILAPLGAGGMGEVYKARDTRLERTVAIKVLPSHLSASAEARQRFEREAKTISQLSHPHICALYDVGNQDGVEFLVMEYLEGETLAERLLKGPLPTEQTLRYGIEIADALDKAHRQGIVHRDLKPGNVMLTRSGVKLLDFGLAKAMGPPIAPSVLTSFPTVAGSPLTQEGTILGTFQYMAPEQLEGKEADARTDLFAFGAVLYEMATGRKAFSGTSQASLISAIMQTDPPAISEIAPMTPPSLNRVVKTCLAKDPEDRFQTGHDVRLQLQWIAEGGSQAGLAPVVARRRSRERLAWSAATLLAVLSLALAVAFWRSRRLSDLLPIRASILPPEKTYFNSVGPTGPVAISPDGRRLVFLAGGKEEKSRLYVRSLDALAAVPLPGTEGASYPFWSPDGKSVAFFADGKLKKTAAEGGAVFDVCEAPEGRGGSWSAEGVILFANRFSPIYRVPAAGGQPSAVTKLDSKRGDTSHRWPQFLPGGGHFLYLASPRGSEDERNALFVASLDGRENRELLRASSNVSYASGHLIFVRGRALVAQPFDADRRKLEGEAIPLAERVQYDPIFTRGVFSASDGALVYQTGTVETASRLTWVARDGKVIAPATPADVHTGPRLSPDGRRAAVTIFTPQTANWDIWVYELEHGTRIRLTFEPSRETNALWSPDGNWIVYSSTRKGPLDLYRRRADGSGGEELLLESSEDKIATTSTPDGRILLFHQSRREKPAQRGSGIWTLSLSEPRKSSPLLQAPFSEVNARISPDGRWLAYQSDESGRPEIYVTPFPAGAGKWQVSTSGGGQPCWSRDGRELYYSSQFSLMAVSFKTEHGFEAAEPVKLFALAPFLGPLYDAAPDGRFLVNVPEGRGDVSPMTLVFNWTADLKK